MFVKRPLRCVSHVNAANRSYHAARDRALCGGAIPARGGLVLSMVRHEPDPRTRRAQPARPRATRTHQISIFRVRSQRTAFSTPPDPSSQKTSTIGGNVATNAGGPHCLSYGTSTNHVLGVEYVDGDGNVHHTSIDDPGYDLTGVLVGSEGTLGNRDVDRRAALDVTRIGARRGRGVSGCRVGVGGRVGDHRRRHRADGTRDDGSADDASRRSALPRRLSARGRRRAARRDRRAARRHGRKRSGDRGRSAARTAASRGATAADAAERDALWASRKGAAGRDRPHRAELLHSRPPAFRARNCPR